MKRTVMSYLDYADRLGGQPVRHRIARGAERGDAALRRRRGDSRPATRGDHAAAARRRQLRPAGAETRRVRECNGRYRERHRGRRRWGRRAAAACRAPQTFYFKIPPNANLLGYWSTVADRLFKLRHCQNTARRRAATGAVRRADRPRPAHRGACRRRRSWQCHGRSHRRAAELPVHLALPAGAGFRERRPGLWRGCCWRRWKRATPISLPC